MQFDKSRAINLLSVVLSRGTGYAVLTTILLIKKLQLPNGEFVNIGHDLVIAALIVTPILSAIGQIQARRIAATQDMKSNLLPVYVVSFVSLTLFAIAAFGQLPETLNGFAFRNTVISCGFFLAQSLLGWLTLWILFCYPKKLFLVVSGLVILCVASIIALRFFFDVMFEQNNLLLEGMLLWIAANIIVLALNFLPQTSKNSKAEKYPLNLSTVSRYVLIVFYAAGILALDWQLLKIELAQAEFEHIANYRIYFERFLLPLWATLASALLLDAYRTSVSEQTPKVSRINISSKQIKAAQVIFVLVFSIALALAPYSSVFWICGLCAGYTVFSVNSFFLDLFQAQVSFKRLIFTLGGFLMAYGIMASVAIAVAGIAGHVIVWCAGNMVLFTIIRSHVRLNNNFNTAPASVGGVAP